MDIPTNGMYMFCRSKNNYSEKTTIKNRCHKASIYNTAAPKHTRTQTHQNLYLHENHQRIFPSILILSSIIHPHSYMRQSAAVATT